MNNLNSALIEGEVENDPESSTSGDEMICSFRVRNVRNHETFNFLVTTEGRLGSVCTKCLRKGRGVRVVGSLHEEEGRVWIEAEHVEFKPVPMRKSE